MSRRKKNCFKPVLFHLKIDSVSHPTSGGGVKLIYTFTFKVNFKIEQAKQNISEVNNS